MESSTSLLAKTMDASEAEAAAQMIWGVWSAGEVIPELPEGCRPMNDAEGHQVQTALARIARQDTAGWKIAATSKAGQQHINVSGPLAGRILAKFVRPDGAELDLSSNRMRVMEAEFVFRFWKNIPVQQDPYSPAEVLEAVDQLQLGIEIPDSRYIDFTQVDAPQLLADNACASWMILGPEVNVEWRGRDLAEHEVRVTKNGGEVAVGRGRNVLEGPLKALTWLVNDLRRRGQMLYRHQFVTTGTCVTPVPIAPGDALVADFSEFGQARVVFSSN